ncbi:uncharacterized protein LOC110248230 [Exaiptasia diaphana]|uniref:Uncharacterized protein n=1 Tax=Exaiptasia diaphana TaxID=2652724 RepID=A0A913XVA3_EXADI|nr:uncharacterized protein LOC110248230 [Exaiptasia diaphana]
MVQTVKNLLKKAGDAGEDPYIALLNYRTTPVDNKLQAPARLLNQREYRTQLPSSGRIQRMKSNDDDLLQLQKRQEIQRQNYAQNRRELGGLSTGQPVAVYNPSSKTWTTAEVKEKLDEPRSYTVKTSNGSELRRNRIHIKPIPTIPEKQPAQEYIQPQPPVSQTTVDTTDRSTTIKEAGTTVTATRSGRIVKPPTKLSLFVGSQPLNC